VKAIPSVLSGGKDNIKMVIGQVLYTFFFTVANE
jgi:hypothetical protein